jgi:hypothetical protein
MRDGGILRNGRSRAAKDGREIGRGGGGGKWMGTRNSVQESEIEREEDTGEMEWALPEYMFHYLIADDAGQISI